MPGKKKKFNSRFPPSRIKKIMQTDEEVGKVAAAVPVIISRALELFVHSLLTHAGDITTARHARTLTPAHLKQCIMVDGRFDFLRELVSTVPDISADGESDAGPLTPITPVTPSGASAYKLLSPSPSSDHLLQGNDHTLVSPISDGDNQSGAQSSVVRGRGRGRGRGQGRGSNSAVSVGRGERRPRGRPRKIAQPLHKIDDPDSDDGMLNVDTDIDEEDSSTDDDDEVEITPMNASLNMAKAKASRTYPHISPHKSAEFTDGVPKVSGLQISVGEGFSLGHLPSSSSNTGNKILENTNSSTVPSLKVDSKNCGSPTSLSTSSVTSPGLNFQITIPGLNCGIVSEGDVPPSTSVIPVKVPNSYATANSKPTFGVPVSVITSVHLAQNKSPESEPYSSNVSISSLHTESNDDSIKKNSSVLPTCFNSQEADEDYDS